MVAYDGNAFVWHFYLFSFWLRPLGFEVSSFMIQKFYLCFYNFTLVSLLKVFSRICSILMNLVSLFMIKWCEAGITSVLYTSLWWLFSFKLKSISALPTYCMGHLLHSKRQITNLLLQFTWWKIINIRPFCWLRNERVFSNL